MKEFVVYTLLRLVVLVATFAIVAGIWIAVAGNLNWFFALVISFLVSGVLSYTLLNRQRSAFAARVDERAHRAAAAFDAMKAKEDAEQQAGAGIPTAERDAAPETHAETPER